MTLSARGVALNLLRHRPYSVAELKTKLASKKFLLEDIESTVSYLTAKGLLDDRAFTKSWINYRVARPFGFVRIKAELKAKGVDEGIIQSAVAVAQQTYNEDEAALELARKRFALLSGIDPQKKMRRISDFLLRRGFSELVVMKALKNI